MLATLERMKEARNTIKEWLWYVPCNRYMAQVMQNELAVKGPEQALALLQASRKLCREYGMDTQ